jgi:hypothetical protein
MEKILTDDTLTQEEAKIVVRKAGARKGASGSLPKATESAAGAGNGMLDPSLAPASGPATQAIEQTTAIARSVGDQASATTSVIYQQGARAGEYLTRNVNRHPLTALLVAGTIGYLTAYLIHPRQPSDLANRGTTDQ